VTIRRKFLVLVLLAAAIPVLTSGLLSYRTAQRALRKAVDDLVERQRS
jgi:hypothetical protein